MPFGITPSAFLLMSTVHFHLSRFNDNDYKFLEERLKSLFVDSLIFGADDFQTVMAKYNESLQVFTAGGFPLRMW